MLDNSIQITGIKRVALILFAALAWFGLRPYFLLERDLWIVIVMYSSFGLVVLSFGLRVRFEELGYFISFLFIAFYFQFPGEGSIDKTIGLGFILVSYVFILEEKYKIVLYSYFKTIFVISLIPGLVIYIFDIAGINIPYSIVMEKVSERGGYTLQYIGFMGNMKPVLFSELGIYRFQAMYPEPGVVGTICALILVIDKFRLKGKQNLFLIVCGFMSLSLGFYLVLFLIYILHTKKNLKNIIAFVILITIILLNPVTQNFILDRFVIVDSKLKADNRVSYESAEIYHRKIVKGEFERKIFGYGADANYSMGFTGSSFIIVILNKGYLGLLLLISFYLLYIFKRLKDRNSIMIMLIWLTVLYHRPNVMALFFNLLFASSVAILRIREQARIPINDNNPRKN